MGSELLQNLHPGEGLDPEDLMEYVTYNNMWYIRLKPMIHIQKFDILEMRCS